MAHCRVLKKRHWLTLDDDVGDLMASEGEETLDNGREERRIEALRGCMGKLREVDRELLMQRYWHKTRLQDFAVVSGRSLGGLKVQLVRLRSTLKRCVESSLNLGELR
jgi:RNA polymerase sigma-70 factor (ECF subfamily)